MDCLDRTNVVQSVIARQILHKILQHQEIQEKKNELLPFESFTAEHEQIFRDQWTENANALSRFYTGTNAQKTDFTKTGKRTNFGLLQDGYYGSLRYIFNNFYDAQKQDSYDLLLGKINLKFQKIEKPIVNPFLICLLTIFSTPFGIKQFYQALASSELIAAYTSIFGNIFKLTPFKIITIIAVSTGMTLYLLFKLFQKNYQKIMHKPALEENKS